MKIKIGMMIEEKLWKEFKELAKKNGMNASLLCQLILAGTVEADKRGMSEVTKNMMLGMVKGSKDIKKKEKENLVKAIMETE